MARTPMRPRLIGCPWLLLCLLLALPLSALAQGAAARAPVTSGYQVVAASYLLRAPDGTLLRVTRYPGERGALGTWDGVAVAPAPREALWLPGGVGRWLGAWLADGSHLGFGLIDYVRESWARIQRLLDYLGVLVLLLATWVTWFLVRPMLIGVPEQGGFALVFLLVGGLWVYVTGLYLSVVYALGLMLLPALVLTLLGWGLRRGWRACRAWAWGVPGRRVAGAAALDDGDWT